MKKYKQIISFFAAFSLICGLTGGAFADNEMYVEIIPETGSVNITVDTGRDIRKISPYIYGINDIGDIRSISPTVIKQTGMSLSTYNWETNYSNSGILGMNANDIYLVDEYPSTKWDTPALYAEKLAAKSRSYEIPVKLITLPMMGYVAADSMGIVSDDEFSKSTRWHKVKFNKNDTYLNNPDTDDDTVYVDEYVSFLVNRFGSSSEGGINGYFLDSEPDKWSENFPVLHEPPLTFSELVDRSAELANAVKAIDSNAFVFGPSLSGLRGCIDLGNSSGRALSDPQNEYSWFIDYYLSEMRARSAEKGYRLLDVLDVHYYTEAQTTQGVDILTGTDDISNAFRMQSVRTLWDPDYTEASSTVMMYKQFTPIIPTLQASIRMNYPKTRLSFSEYDFGGGSNMSGAIAEIDALGIFASQEVYLACLAPQSEDYPFQKAALNLFTNYDGNGSGFGTSLVYSDNENDNMSSVYAALDDSDPEILRLILTNKQMVNEKDFRIEISSDEYTYELESAAAIDKETAEIYQPDTEMFDCSDNIISFSADTTSAYMLVLRGTVPEAETEDTDSLWVTDSSEAETVISDITSESADPEVSESEEPVIVTESSEYEFIDPSDETVPDLIETEITVPSFVEEVTSETEITSDQSITEEITSETSGISDENEKESKVPMPLKIIISLMCLTVVVGMGYVMLFDKK